MANNTIKVTVSKDNALTIEEFVQKCKEKYGWKEAFFRATDGYIRFKEDDADSVWLMDLDGNVCKPEADGTVSEPINHYDIRDDFDWVNCIWGDDENGNPIVVFQI